MKIDGRYVFSAKLGSGAFSQVYAGQDSKTGTEIAVKIDTSNVKSGTKRRDLVTYEGDVLSHLHGDSTLRGVPRVLWSGTLNSKNGKTFPAIVIDRLGDDLEKVMDQRGKLSAVEVARLGLALVKILERVHRAGILHRDLKPANIMLGYNDAELYIADFGLAKKYLTDDGEHIPYVENKKGITGTIRYCSSYSHYGIESSRRDDMQSLVFILLHMLDGSLPWQSSFRKAKNEAEDGSAKSDGPARAAVGKLKNSALIQERNLWVGHPVEFKAIADHVADLGFYDAPDYKFIRAKLQQLAPVR
jgi:casein kinase 1